MDSNNCIVLTQPEVNPEVKKTHYIAMSGLSGCIPNNCEVFPTYTEAVNFLVELLDLSNRKKRILRYSGYVDLDKYNYCEISQCNCNNHVIHSDSGEYSESEDK